SASLLILAIACSSSNPDPSTDPQPQADPRSRTGQQQRRPGVFDSTRGNRVTENARPDAPARAGLIVVANQEAASATVLDAATLKTLATLPVGVGPHEVAIS